MINGKRTNWLTRYIAAAIIAALLAVGLTVSLAGCASNNQPPTPTTWTVAYQGTTYCPYEYDPREAYMYGYAGASTCTPVAFPSISLVPTTPLQILLMTYWTTYSGFYESGYWYDTYYSPLSTRYTHVIVISRRSYMSNVTMFDHTYSSQIKSNGPKASWSGGKKGNYSFPTSNKAKSGPASNTGGGGGSGTKTKTGTGSGSGKGGTVGGTRRR